MAATARRRLRLRRIYDAPADGSYRVLIDRLWPRGVKREDAALDEWLKDAAPSTELRQWYGHAVERFDEFARRYEAELARPPAADAVRHLVQLSRSRAVTLLTATRDVDHSAAAVLERYVTSAS